MLARIAKRIGVILFGYIAACFAGGLSLGRLTPLLLPEQLGGFFEDTHGWQYPIQEALAIGGGVAIVSFIPAVISAVLTELAKMRNPLIYLLLGAGWAVLWSGNTSRSVVFAISGGVAGAVYWAIAGRGAGISWAEEVAR